jgi:hypothetical protein
MNGERCDDVIPAHFPSLIVRYYDCKNVYKKMFDTDINFVSAWVICHKRKNVS